MRTVFSFNSGKRSLETSRAYGGYMFTLTSLYFFLPEFEMCQ